MNSIRCILWFWVWTEWKNSSMSISDFRRMVRNKQLVYLNFISWCHLKLKSTWKSLAFLVKVQLDKCYTQIVATDVSLFHVNHKIHFSFNSIISRLKHTLLDELNSLKINAKLSNPASVFNKLVKIEPQNLNTPMTVWEINFSSDSQWPRKKRCRSVRWM
jgi:hypothetical protein